MFNTAKIRKVSYFVQLILFNIIVREILQCQLKSTKRFCLITKSKESVICVQFHKENIIKQNLGLKFINTMFSFSENDRYRKVVIIPTLYQRKHLSIRDCCFNRANVTSLPNQLMSESRKFEHFIPSRPVHFRKLYQNKN